MQHNKVNKRAIGYRLFSAVLITLLLSACSGGSGGGGSEREDTVSASSLTGFVYSGPVAANTEIQHFKTTFYDNVVIRCGSCHSRGGSGPSAFVDNDDVNIAFQQALSVVNLLDPGASAVVQRVANGHNCWLDSNAACAATLTGYIERWAQGASASVSTVTLLPRQARAVNGSKVLPDSFSDAQLLMQGAALDLTAEPELMYLLRSYCSDCHAGSAATPQSPYFASDDNDIAYAALLGKVDLGNPANSRFVVRLADKHNCWTSDCDADAQTMQSAIARFAATVPAVNVDANLVISTAQILEEDGIIASSGGRYEQDVIAKWEFREGEGALVADTSGVQPEIPMTLLGQYEWVGGWGVRLIDGRVQGAVSGSSKLHSRLAIAGEYSIEAWVAPNNVAQEDAWIFGYAGGPSSRNTLLTQTLYNYDFYNRSSINAQSDGGPALSTDDDDEIAQASLQHVVLTYNPVSGRRIYVNGVDTGAVDQQQAGNLSNWSDAFAVVMGNDFAGGSPWAGVVRMVAVHSSSLSQAQIVQNYNVGVGQKYYLMFSVSELLDEEGVCHRVENSEWVHYCYIVYEVSQFDNSSYLFNTPYFVNINPDAENTSLNFDLEGIYLGINGKLAVTGQGFVNIDTQINGSVFTLEDDPLQLAGSIIPLENGPDRDIFFLAFETIDDRTDLTAAETPGTFSYTLTDEEFSQIGLRTFDEVNHTFSLITSIPIDSATVSAVTGKTIAETFTTVRRSLASQPDFQSYMASHQMAVTQLAAAYCDALVEDTVLRANFFTDGTPFDFSAAVASVSNPEWSNRVIYPLIDRAFATGLDNTQPNRPLDGNPADGLADRGEVHDELLNLITNINDDAAYELNPDGKSDGLKYCDTSPCPAGRTREVVKAVCTAVLSSAAVVMK